MSQEENPVVGITTIDDFAKLITDWFTDCQSQLAYAANVPENVKIKAIIDGKEKELTFKERQAFMAGVTVVGEIFKQLPFQSVEASDEQAVDDSGK